MRIEAPIVAFGCNAPASPESTAAPGRLPKDAFASVVANAPLVAIDLIVENSLGEVLLGLRNNPPAKGYWFVPGGRIRKNESLDSAFVRIAHDELGLDAQRTGSAPAGVFEHFYDIDFNGVENATTHYVVLAYRLQVAPQSLQPPHQQHSSYQWMQPGRITSHPDVHPYTKAYFESTRP